MMEKEQPEIKIRIKPFHLLSALVFLSLITSGFTAFKLVQLENSVNSIGAAQPSDVAGSTEEANQQFSFPTGTPAAYGEELDVRYGDVSQDNPDRAEKTIRKFASYESIELSENERERYINILYLMNGGISCEYCCEARSVITEDGEPGCGCSHAAAMRGLTKYLLENNGNQMTDREIFEEVSKWKTRYFPTQTESKAEGLRDQGAEVTYINLASNQYRGVSSRKGGWVGDC